MEAFSGLLPIVVLLAYGSVQGIYDKSIKCWWVADLIFAGTAGFWYIIHLFCSMKLTNLMVFVILELFFFELFHVGEFRKSLLLHCLFYLGVALTAGSTFIIPESIVINEYILLLLYFLTESNQRYLRKTYEESATLYQNQLLNKQVSEVQNIYMTMRGWRHDYHNHLQTLKAHLKLNQIEEASTYLDRLEVDLDNINQLIESGNVNLDAILNSKLSLALKDDIEINYKAEVPSALTVSDIDLCVLIGNLIDNAVEACNKMEVCNKTEDCSKTEYCNKTEAGKDIKTCNRRTEQGESKFIRLYIGVLKKQLYISVTNSTNEVIRKLDEDYITTKRGNHGHGLKRINNIVEKYEGYINRKNEPGVFVTEIMLPL